MHKILLIINREYISRVRNRTFLISTILTPLFFVLLIAGSIYFSAPPDQKHKIALSEENSYSSLQPEDIPREENNKKLAYSIGLTSGVLIYITMMVYGMMVLRGVMEEKTNRIAEVIVSSVRPFQLMMGKIIGIGLVGITQFLLWIVLILLFVVVGQSFLSQETLEQVRQLQNNGGIVPGGGLIQAGEKAQKLYSIQHTISTANWPLIIGCFIFYFIGGYLFYAALFAAAGSVTDDSQSSSSLTIPVTMPIIFSFIILTSTIQIPNSQLAVWASMIPFSAPTVMMARIAHGVPGTVPYWQLLVSMLSLVAGFLLTTWLAGKIYSTGILLYGKKATWKEMLKWAIKAS